MPLKFFNVLNDYTYIIVLPDIKRVMNLFIREIFLLFHFAYLLTYLKYRIGKTIVDDILRFENCFYIFVSKNFWLMSQLKMADI